MPSTRERVYAYLFIIAVPILCALYIKQNIVYNMNTTFNKIPAGSKMELRCDVSTLEPYFVMPNIIWVGDINKERTFFGLLQYQNWSVHTYEAKIKVRDSIDNRQYVPKGEFLVVDDKIIKEIDQNGKIIYTISLSEPPELSEIIISHYIDYCTGFFGQISYIIETVYPKDMTIKEFNKVMACVNNIILNDGENKNGQ